MSKNSSYTILYIGIAVAFGVFIGSFFNFKGKPANPFSESSQEAKIKRITEKSGSSFGLHSQK